MSSGFRRVGGDEGYGDLGAIDDAAAAVVLIKQPGPAGGGRRRRQRRRRTEGRVFGVSTGELISERPGAPGTDDIVRRADGGGGRGPAAVAPVRPRKYQRLQVLEPEYGSERQREVVRVPAPVPVMGRSMPGEAGRVLLGARAPRGAFHPEALIPLYESSGTDDSYDSDFSEYGGGDISKYTGMFRPRRPGENKQSYHAAWRQHFDTHVLPVEDPSAVPHGGSPAAGYDVADGAASFDGDAGSGIVAGGGQPSAAEAPGGLRGVSEAADSREVSSRDDHDDCAVIGGVRVRRRSHKDVRENAVQAANMALTSLLPVWVQVVQAEVKHWHDKEPMHAAFLAVASHLPVAGLCACGQAARILCNKCGRHCVACSSKAHRGVNLFHSRWTWLLKQEKYGGGLVDLYLKHYVAPGMEPVKKGLRPVAHVIVGSNMMLSGVPVGETQVLEETWVPILALPPPRVCICKQQDTCQRLENAYFRRRVSVINMEGRFDNIALPVFVCSSCRKILGNPLDVLVTPDWNGDGLPCGYPIPDALVLRVTINGSGTYFAATPVIVNTIIDIEVFNAYADLTLNGLSWLAVTGALNEASRRRDPFGYKECDPTLVRESGLQFARAKDVSYAAVWDVCPEKYCGFCPACAYGMKKSASDADCKKHTLAHVALVRNQADAAAKIATALARFRRGRIVTSTERSAAMQLSISAASKDVPAVRGHVQAFLANFTPGLQPQCGERKMTCAGPRATVPAAGSTAASSGASPLVIKSIAAILCDHGGVQTAAVNMRPETLACHVAMLLELFERGQKTQLHCVDFACIFAQYVKNNHMTWNQQSLTTAFDAVMKESGYKWSADLVKVAEESLRLLCQTRFRVNQWHILCHVWSCNLPYNEVFDLLNGRATGEICEQLWSRINASVRSDRLSSLVHFEDTFNRQVLREALRCEREFCAKSLALLRSNKREEARLLELLKGEVKKLSSESQRRFGEIKDIFAWAEDTRLNLIKSEKLYKLSPQDKHLLELVELTEEVAMDDVDLPKQIANVSKTIPTALAGCTSSKFVKDLRENVGKRAKTVGRRKKRLAVLEKKYSCTARTLNQDLLKRVCLVAAALEAHKAEDARAQFWMTSKAALVLARNQKKHKQAASSMRKKSAVVKQCVERIKRYLGILSTFVPAISKDDSISFDNVLEDDTVSIMHAFRRAFLASAPAGVLRCPDSAFDDFGIAHHRLVRLVKIIAELRRCNNDYIGVPADLRKAIANIDSLLGHLAMAVRASDDELAGIAADAHHPLSIIGVEADVGSTVHAFRSMLTSAFAEQRVAICKCEQLLSALTTAPLNVQLCGMVPAAAAAALAHSVAWNDSGYSSMGEDDEQTEGDEVAEESGVDGDDEEGHATVARASDDDDAASVTSE